MPTFLRVGVEPEDEFFSCCSDSKATETETVAVDDDSKESRANVLKVRRSTTGHSSKSNSLGDDSDSVSFELRKNEKKVFLKNRKFLGFGN